VCTDGYVYNIEVEKDNNYFANGVLVHNCKNSTTLRAKAMRSLAKTCERVILLTGTPVTNRPAELYPLLNMVDPKSWGNFMSFAYEYCGAYNNGWGMQFDGASNLDKLHQEIKPYVVRRTKSQVLTELPEKRHSTLTLEFDAKLKAVYEQAIQNVLDGWGTATAAQHLTLIEACKQAAARAKLQAAIRWINDFIETGEKIVVFATHHFVVDALMDAFGNKAVRLTGSENQKERDQAVYNFQNDQNIMVFVGNIKAAGVGITLTAASNVAFLEFPWTSGDLIQAADRVHRIGQQNAVTVYYMVAEKTIDEDICELLQQKAQIIDEIVDGAPQNNFDILKALSSRLLKTNP